MQIFSRNVLAAMLFALLSFNSPACQAAEETLYQRVDELLAQGENQQAWELLREGADKDSSRGDIAWRMARTQYEMGRLAESGQQAMVFFQAAEEYAREAMQEAPNKSDGYKWLAIILGAQAKYTDTATQVRHSRELKNNIEKAIALNPDDDIAYLVLSRWHYKISELGFFVRAVANTVYGGLPEASLQESEKLLLQAIRLHDRIAHRYNLAKIYDRMDRPEDVKKQYQQAILLPVTFPEEVEEREKALRRLKNWQ